MLLVLPNIAYLEVQLEKFEGKILCLCTVTFGHLVRSTASDFMVFELHFRLFTLPLQRFAVYLVRSTYVHCLGFKAEPKKMDVISKS